MNKNIFFSTLTGKRKSNEDSHFIYLNKDTKNDKYAKIDIYGIFDGHGGVEVSKFISNEFPKYLLNKKLKYPWSKTQIINICDEIQENVKKFNYSYRVGSTALIVAIFELNQLQFMNILNTGDCRAVICNSNNIGVQLTKDHSPNTFSERNRIEKLGGKIVNDEGTWRIKKLSVSRSFGDYDTFPYVTHRPELYTYSISGNKFLIIACDGLWESLSNDDATEYVLNKCYLIENNIQVRKKELKFNIAHDLANYAIEKGSGDNVSVIVIFFDK